MLKLLKYDLKYVYKMLVNFYIFTLIFAIFTRVLIEIDINFTNALALYIFIPITILCAIGTLIYTVMRNWNRFIKNLYSDESYLTHTLPVTKNAILLSKFLTEIVSLTTSVLVIIASLSIMFYSKGTMEHLSLWIDTMGGAKIIILALILVFLEILTIIKEGNTGIIIGHRANDHKIAKSIFSGFIIFSLTAILFLGALLIAGLFSKELMDSLFTNTITDAVFTKVVYGGLCLYLTANVIYYMIDLKLLKSGVNVD